MFSIYSLQQAQAFVPTYIALWCCHLIHKHTNTDVVQAICMLGTITSHNNMKNCIHTHYENWKLLKLANRISEKLRNLSHDKSYKYDINNSKQLQTKVIIFRFIFCIQSCNSIVLIGNHLLTFSAVLVNFGTLDFIFSWLTLWLLQMEEILCALERCPTKYTRNISVTLIFCY